MHSQFVVRGLLAALLATLSIEAVAWAGQQPPDAAPRPFSVSTSLADPTVADALKLTDEQRMKIAALLTQRAESLAKADVGARAEVAKQFEEKFLAVLNDEQRSQLAGAATDVEEERKLRFNFRFQRWSDVLEWFADQAGLSLVLDAPPPGTFNYSDRRDYTVAESLDLLNGVLLTKDYTLVRRGQMLILVDLSQGVPETLVPRITLDELDKRGRFELVSVLFTVGTREASDVVTEIAPLLSPRGKSQPLPKTRQVLVTDTAGVMRAVHAVIESMPEPKSAAPDEPPQKPQLVVYPLTSADPAAAVEVLKALLPGAQFVRDPKANQLSAYATPNEQTAIKNVLDQMQTTLGTADNQSRFEVYQLDDVDLAGALATLQPLVPAARLSLDPASKKLAAWGTPADHAILEKAVAQLGGAPSGDDDRQVEVYRLRKADPASVVTLLQSVVPRARMAVDAPTKSIVVLASLADQKTIRATIEQIDSKNPAAVGSELRFYALEQATPGTLPTVLQQLAPAATITVDAAEHRLSVVATPEDHTTIKNAIDAYLKATPGRAPRQLVLYPVSAAERQRFQTVLADLIADFPNVKVITDAEPGELAVWATQKEHEVVADIVKQLKQDTPADESYQLVAYPIRVADPASVMTVLQNLFPATKLVLDVKTRRLVAWTRPEEQRSIKSLIEQMDTDEPGETQLKLMVYPVSGFDAAAAITTLNTVAPEATVTQDTTAKTIVAWARKSDHEKIAAALQRLRPDADPTHRPHVVSYSVGDADPNTLSPLITALVPTARLAPDATTKTIAVWATPEEHVTIKGAIEEMTANQDDRQIEVYRLRKADPASVATTLQSVVPRARVAVDLPTKSIVVLASLADQKTVRATIEQIDSKNPAPGAPELRFYSLERASSGTLPTVLQQLVPTATVTVDAAERRLSVVATPEDHATVKLAIDEYIKSTPGRAARQLVLYPVSAAERQRFQTVLTDLIADFPNVKVITDAEPGELAVWATEKEHAVISDIVEQLKQDTPADESYQLVAYSIRVADPASVMTVLQNLFPATKLVLDAKTGRLVAWTRPAEQRSIKSLIEQMDTDEPGESQLKLMVYPVFGFDAAAAITTLGTVAPKATITQDTTAKTIVAWARKSDHEKIAAVLDRMRPDADPTHRPHVVSYSVGNAVPSALSPLITALVPTARVAPDAASRSIAVWATPEEHVTIKGAIEEMVGPKSDADAAKVVVYSLKETEAGNIISALQTAVPQARVGVGQNTRKLVVWARPAEHDTIRETLKELDTFDTIGPENVLKAYPINAEGGGAVLSTLQTLFATRPTVRLSFDGDNRKIVAIATSKEHESIRRVIDEIEHGSPVDDKAQFEVHPLRDADSTVVMQVLNNVLGKGSRAILSVDAAGRQLVAVATPEQQETIRDTIDRLQTAGRELEVFQLDIVDPFAAEMAIQKLFTDAARGGAGQREAPIVESDTTAARLYVRATKQDLTEIRNLLVKMGETRLAQSNGAGGTVRIIPFSGDTRAAIAEIERIWPRLSKSPLRVLATPSRRRDAIRPRSVKPETPGADNEPQEPAVEPRKSEADHDQQSRNDARRAVVEVKTAAQQDEPPPAEKQDPPQPAAENQKPPAPIIVSPGDDRITIMSDDPEAIEQFEALLRSLSPPAGAGGRAVTVYPLRRANSAAVVELLKRIFRRGAFDFGDSSSPVIEADERLNAIVVYAGRNDRAVIEQLLEVLDSDEVPDSLVADRPTMIPVQHTDAAAIEQILRDLYQTQLTSGTRRQQIPIPSGASRDVASVIQQINTAATGPLMTMGVDQTTNSIVVMAPGPLVEEVSQLVKELDEAALNDTSRSVKVVKLHNASAEQIKEVLDDLIRNSTKRRSDRRRSRR